MGNLEIDGEPYELAKSQLSKGTSKVATYRLEDNVISMYTEGFSLSRIAKECNNILNKRDDDVSYIPLNHMNVKMYLLSFQKALDKSGSSYALALADKVPNVFEKLTNMVNILEVEIDQLRSMDGPIDVANRDFFLSLIKKLEDTISLASTLSGKLDTGTNITIITKNIGNLTTKIVNAKDIPDKAKGIILDLVQNELLKDVTGEVD